MSTENSKGLLPDNIRPLCPAEAETCFAEDGNRQTMSKVEVEAIVRFVTNRAFLDENSRGDEGEVAADSEVADSLVANMGVFGIRHRDDVVEVVSLLKTLGMFVGNIERRMDLPVIQSSSATYHDCCVRLMTILARKVSADRYKDHETYSHSQGLCDSQFAHESAYGAWI